MQNLNTKSQANVEKDLTAFIADRGEIISEAQQLRFDVFRQEFNAGFGHQVTDADTFDQYCKHLVIMDNCTGKVVATTRILTSDSLALTGRYYSETEFSLPDSIKKTNKVMEVGRTCIHPNYRHGPALTLLWMGIGKFLLENNYRYLIGCGSIGIKDNGQQAWCIAQHLKQTYPADAMFAVTPKRQMPHLAMQTCRSVTNDEIPALLRAYMRLGAKICGDPCWDPTFKTADVFIFLDVEEMTPRYKRHFLKSTALTKSAA
ncbi:MAG: GNAT family N-acetyltransferase [Hahellaceae bacterium]|jgi:putative hemolysin|nr:GNAT family N-acetyltransferase [Hahellaceae bacterium]MCP5212414.1 GNAT family N-acetyltransferase [Hahellaceae bacterium]